MTLPTFTIHCGDVLAVLKTMASESVHCVITSPPYWGLRDYGTALWEGGDPACGHFEPQGGTGAASAKQNTSIGSQRLQYKTECKDCGASRVDKQIGLERTPELYVRNLTGVLSEVKRVLRQDGTLWLNLGDSYTSGGRGSYPNADQINGSKQATSRAWNDELNAKPCPRNPEVPQGMKPKDLVGIPWMVAFELRKYGWYLRSDIIWAKPNPMPESVTDRPTKSHEYLFLLSKSPRYYFDSEAVKETATSTDNSLRDRDSTKLNNTPGRTRMDGLTSNGYTTRNIRSVWTIPTQSYSEAHFATFPEDLVKPCILAGTSEKGVCGECGAPWERIVERSPMEINRSNRGEKIFGNGHSTAASGTMTKPSETKTLGWQPSCTHEGEPIAAAVMDIFCGSGTTGVVSLLYGRNFIGIELNPAYAEMAKRRITSDSPLFNAEAIA